MPSNYTGNPTATQAPSPAPSLDADPIGALVADADAQAAASYIHPEKVALDWIAFLRRRVREITGTLVNDHFIGSAVATHLWNPSNSPTIIDDSANGAHGACQMLGASGQGLITTAGAFGTRDFRFEARVRVAGVTGTSQLFAGIGFGSNDLFFQIKGASSTTNWRVSVNTVDTAPNGTPVAISAGYVTLELTRTANVVTFKINGTTLHSIPVYATSLTPCAVSLAALTAGNMFADYAVFQLLS
jgi:hypothetical protein